MAYLNSTDTNLAYMTFPAELLPTCGKDD